VKIAFFGNSVWKKAAALPSAGSWLLDPRILAHCYGYAAVPPNNNTRVTVRYSYSFADVGSLWCFFFTTAQCGY